MVDLAWLVLEGSCYNWNPLRITIEDCMLIVAFVRGTRETCMFTVAFLRIYERFVCLL